MSMGDFLAMNKNNNDLESELEDSTTGTPMGKRKGHTQSLMESPEAIR